MRRLALVSALLGVLALAGAAVVGLLGVDTDYADRTYDCGAPIARLGGDDREKDWQEETFLATEDPAFADVPPEDLPQAACKDKTDDRLTIVYALVALGVVLLLVAVVLFFVSRPRRHPDAPTGSTSRPDAPPSPAT